MTPRGRRRVHDTKKSSFPCMNYARQSFLHKVRNARSCVPADVDFEFRKVFVVNN